MEEFEQDYAAEECGSSASDTTCSRKDVLQVNAFKLLFNIFFEHSVNGFTGQGKLLSDCSRDTKSLKLSETFFL